MSSSVNINKKELSVHTFLVILITIAAIIIATIAISYIIIKNTRSKTETKTEQKVEPEGPKFERLSVTFHKIDDNTIFLIVKDNLTDSEYLVAKTGVVKMTNPADFLFPLPQKEEKKE